MEDLNSRTGGGASDPQVKRAEPPEPPEPPEPSCVSVKSDASMEDRPYFSSEPVPSDPEWQSFRAEPPESSCVSLKSNTSMPVPPDFSNERISIDMSYERVLLTQDQSRCGLCEQTQTEPVSITCGHTFCRQCIDSYRNKSAHTEYFACPLCRKRSKTHPIPYTHKVMSMEQGYCQPVDNVLQRVSERHKASMKNRYESLFEGIKTQENKTLLNRIYTQLYIMEGESERVNKDHEVLKMEKKHWNKCLQETSINCLDIFRPVQQSPGERKNEELKVKKLRSVLTKGIAGIGKTVSVQKFILDWAEGEANQDVDLMVMFPFRELNLIKDDPYSVYGLLCDFHPEFKDLDPEVYEECKCVFIFDGLDESRIPLNFSQSDRVSDINTVSSVDVLMTNLIRGELFPSALIWITSRPAAANQIPPQYIDRVTEIQGFNDPQKEEYFRKRISDPDQANSIISHIKTARSLHIMCHIPVFCWISATVLQQILTQHDTEIPKTLTEMYSHFLGTQTIMRNEKYEGKNDRDPEELQESNRKVLLKMAELAFKQLTKGNVMFYEEDLKECGIDVTEASVYSGIYTEIFREESVLYQRKVYCFVHLSFQEFLAALFVFHCFVSKNMEELQVLKPQNTKWSESVLLEELLKGAVLKALRCENGHLDLFLRFLLGISLESNQQLLRVVLTETVRSSESIKKTVEYIKRKIQTEDLPSDRSINLFLCLTEMKKQSLSKKVQKYLKSTKHSEKKFSAGECSSLAYMILSSEEVMDELNLKNYNTSEEGYLRLIPAVSNCRKAILFDHKLTMKSCETLCSALKSPNSPLIVLDLSNTDLQDSGVEVLADGLKSSHCKLGTLRLSFCNLGVKTCESLGSVFSLENSLKNLDLSNNDLQDSGVELLSAGLKSSHCKLETLRVSGCKLSEQSCQTLQSVLQSENSLKDLDLSNNDLQDSGVELLSAGLKSSHCKLETLRLSGCMITAEGCSSLDSALSSNPSHVKELDLIYNHPGESGVKLLSARLEDPHCSLSSLRVDHGGEIRIKPGLKKYGCLFTLDPNTAHTFLSLSEENRKVERVRERQSYPDHPERFDYWKQVVCRETMSGRCYWEVEWNGVGVVGVSVTHKSIRRKGESEDCVFGRNGKEKSWILEVSENSYSVVHNNKSTAVPPPPSRSNRVGVYVDCPTGTLSFYSVSSDTHTLTHLHTFNTTFTEPLCAGFRFFSFLSYGSSVSLCKIE